MIEKITTMNKQDLLKIVYNVVETSLNELHDKHGFDTNFDVDILGGITNNICEAIVEDSKSVFIEQE